MIETRITLQDYISLTGVAQRKGWVAQPYGNAGGTACGTARRGPACGTAGGTAGGTAFTATPVAQPDVSQIGRPTKILRVRVRV